MSLKLGVKSFLLVGTYAWFESCFGEGLPVDLFLACRNW